MVDMSQTAHVTVSAHAGQASIAAPFRWLGGAAIIAAGLIAAAIAYHPTEHLVWMVAYLVLVVGVVQYAFGVGQARLSVRALSAGGVWARWVLLNLGHAGVIAGTLADWLALVVAGTVFYILAVAWLGVTVRGPWRDPGRAGYRVLVLVMLASSLTGLALSGAG
jgi:hypothetical protein